MDGWMRLACGIVMGATSVSWAPGQDDEFEPARQLLSALEEADQDLDALTAAIRYYKTFAIAGDEQVRDGAVTFVATPVEGRDAPKRGFAIDFTRMWIGRREEEILERYVFDGEWLLELDLEEKQFTRRQIVPPGETFDPLRIGEGPFPIPIGQRPEDILRRFDAELAEPTAGIREDESSLRTLTSQWSQLKLVPKASWEDEIEFAEIRLWYQRRDDGMLLPRMARTLNVAGDESTVILANIKVNEEARIDRSKLDTNPPREGWNGQIIEWRGE